MYIILKLINDNIELPVVTQLNIYLLNTIKIYIYKYIIKQTYEKNF